MLVTKPIDEFEYKEDISPKWRNVTLENATDKQIDELIEEIAKKKLGINLGVPFTAEAVYEFFELFKCQGCGYCCREGDGKGIVLMPDEVEIMASLGGMTKRMFKDEYTIIEDDKRLMKYPCFFYDQKDKFCKVYYNRPKACRLFPLNATRVAKNFNQTVDGVALLIVHSGCPEGRRLACGILKAIAKNHREHKVDKNQVEECWRKARKEQAGLRIY